MTDLREQRTAVYRLQAADHALLYVGISDCPWARFTQHAADKSWWPEVVHVSIEWHPARGLAEQAERDAIRNEQPRHNIRHAVTPEGQFALAVAVTAAERARVLQEDAWAAILEARQAGVLDTVLCEETKRSRATLNRRYGPRTD